MVPGHTGRGRRLQQDREGGGTGSRFKFQPCRPVTLGRSQLKAQGEPGGVVKWGNPLRLWLCPGLGAWGKERARPGGREEQTWEDRLGVGRCSVHLGDSASRLNRQGRELCAAGAGH